MTGELGDWEGPLTECQAAAVDYELRFGWSCGALGHEAWLQLRDDMAALSVPFPLARSAYRRLARPGPVIAHPGRFRHWVFLLQAAEPSDEPLLAALNWRDAVYLPGPHLVDLPPTRTPHDGPLTWMTPPLAGGSLPTFAQLSGAILRA